MTSVRSVGRRTFASGGLLAHDGKRWVEVKSVACGGKINLQPDIWRMALLSVENALK